MIRLKVEEYCHSCLDFTPSVTQPRREACDGDFKYYLTDTLVECKYRNRCANITRYLTQQLKEAVE